MCAVPASSQLMSSTSVQGRRPIRGSLVWWLRFLGVAAFIAILLRLPGPTPDKRCSVRDLSEGVEMYVHDEDRSWFVTVRDGVAA